MKKTNCKIIITLIISIITILLLRTNSNAASLNVSASKSSVAPNESFTVTVTLNGGAGPISASVSNGSGSNTQFLDNSSMSFTCTAGESGTVSISASGTVGDYATEQDIEVRDGTTVTIIKPEPKPEPQPEQQPETKPEPKPEPQPEQKPEPVTYSEPEIQKSENNKLKSLSILEGAITPEFNEDVKEYTLTVKNEIEKVNILVETSDNKASYVVSENKDNLQIGENELTVTVKAEDGTTNIYTVKITRENTKLALTSLEVSYTDNEKNIKELVLTPQFKKDILNYKLEEIPSNINKLDIKAVANIEGAKIEINGNNELQQGKNIITITVCMPSKEQQENEQTVTYTLEVNKKEEVIASTATIGSITNWFNDNFRKHNGLV